MREQPSKLQHQTKIHPHRFHSEDSKIKNFLAQAPKARKTIICFIADGTARMTESSSSMVTDAAGTDDQSDEDSGKFMHKKELILIFFKKKKEISIAS
jgi:hypothetical protein